MHPTRLDKKAGQVLVLVIVVLFEHRAVLFLTNGAIGLSGFVAVFVMQTINVVAK